MYTLNMLFNMHLLVSTIILLGLTNISVRGDLVAVVQIFRHGHRTPVSTFSTDPYADSSYWDYLDEGQLTNIGKRQHYELGQYTRKRYKNFLPTKYNSTLFYVETTDVDRTHMSAQTNVYGMFPATGTQIWRKGINWQAIPIHPANSSIFATNFYPTECAAYTPLLTAALNGEEYEELNDEYSSLFEYLTEYSGDNISDFTDVNSIWDSLKAEDTASFRLPSWTDAVYPEPLRTLEGKIFEVYTHTTQMKRFVSGLFLNEVVEYLESMANDSTSAETYRIYSGHDTNIAATLNCFGVFDPPFPPAYASTIYIELHYENWQYLVRVFTKDGDTLTQISVNGCDVDCPIADFREYLSDIILDSDTWISECNDTSTSSKVLSVGQYTDEIVTSKWGGKSN
ncbi:prostatic acid phosphatase-like [Diorhabda sublineata]|uniref:prostatic acid phosphatase-like n=1 Tax=Diorhabda sublineata TaxID=1163346 RepID=UPI0024E04E34|nr:prostatic acid phosphatase-like [Diorhabda sublineata]